MGLKGKKNKDIEKNKPETIGGLTDSGEISMEEITAQQSDETPPPSPPPPPVSTGSTLGGPAPTKKEEKPDVGGGLSGLDIFSEETGGEEGGNKLAEELPEVDIHELLDECREISARLAEYDSNKN